MSKNNSANDLIIQLQHQLSVARSEIKNLRQEIVSLKFKHKNDIDNIQKALQSWKCQYCKVNPETPKCNCEFPNFHSIGTIESWFCHKRGVPRQGVLCNESQGVLTLNSSVLNNPAYALKGLEEFSHLWIIYYFDQTNANHIRCKVAPPKLNGKRVGVFSTRSPHRPCPIGLSIVRVDKLNENKIFFSGVDMLNGTPVLDIKPYIPQYDNPVFLGQLHEREVEGGLPNKAASTSNVIIKEGTKKTEFRGAPDGEEESICIPPWILNSGKKKLKVEFTEKGLFQINELNLPPSLQKTIVNILEEDPRSVYLKEKLGNQFFTFLIKNLHVTCKFDDSNSVVNVYQVNEANQNS